MNCDALETDWSDLLPATERSFVFGNPPFIGAKYQTAGQRDQVRRIAGLGKSGGTLDYVAAWFIEAGEYVNYSDARIGFVATNSITQGEQVAQLWPVLFGRCELEIAFAHRTFARGPEARGKAHQALDKAVDRLYRPRGFASERERVEHLFMLYEKIRALLRISQSSGRGKRRGR